MAAKSAGELRIRARLVQLGKQRTAAIELYQLEFSARRLAEAESERFRAEVVRLEAARAGAISQAVEKDRLLGIAREDARRGLEGEERALREAERYRRVIAETMAERYGLLGAAPR